MVTTAVIMAAGLGSRFGMYTEDRPKGFIEVGGKSMIERSVETLLTCGIKRIIIGTGYMKENFERLAQKYTEIECCYSPRYAETNSMYTLYNMRELIREDFLLLESDLIYERRAIELLLSDSHPDIMLTTPVFKFQDQYYVEFNEDHWLTNCSTDKTTVNTSSELVGIHKVSLPFFKLMTAAYHPTVDSRPKLGYEFALLETAQTVRPMYVLDVPGLQWYEIDDPEDKKYAEQHVVKHL